MNKQTDTAKQPQLITANGRSMTLYAWSRLLGKTVSGLKYRIAHMPLDQALSKYVDEDRKAAAKAQARAALKGEMSYHTEAGRTQLMSEWSVELGVPVVVLFRRLNTSCQIMSPVKLTCPRVNDFGPAPKVCQTPLNVNCVARDRALARIQQASQKANQN